MSGTLVIQPLPGIGDMVWHLPHLEAIAAASPDQPITVLAKRRSRADELFEGSALVRQVLWLERAQKRESAGRHDGVLGALRLAIDLRRHSFGTVWILHDSSRYALAARLAGIPFRFGFGAPTQRRLLTDRRVLSAAELALSPVEKATRLLAAHGLAVAPTPRMTPSDSATARIGERFGALPRPWIAMGIGSSEPFKQWGTPAFSTLARLWLLAVGGTVFAVGGPDEESAATIIRLAAGDAVVPALALPLADTAALAHACDVVIGNDSGFLNLAAATGAACVGLFGGSPPLTQYPNLTPLEPAGGAVYRDDRMGGIGVEMALAAALDALPGTLPGIDPAQAVGAL